MTDNKQHDTRTARRPDCVTEIRMGNSVLVVSGYFKKDTTTTAADKMARVLEAEAPPRPRPIMFQRPSFLPFSSIMKYLSFLGTVY